MCREIVLRRRPCWAKPDTVEGPELHRFWLLINHLITQLPNAQSDRVALVNGEFRYILVTICHLHKLIPAYARARLTKSFQMFADLLSSLQHFVEAGLAVPEYVPTGLLSPAPVQESSCLRDLVRNFDSHEFFEEVKRGMQSLHDHLSSFQHPVMSDVLADVVGFGSDVLLVRKGDRRLHRHR